ncbi:MAG: DUF1592 domain-containing protein [Thermoanaerobaculia bacterium]|nr:DUF1592 domain-containing protein [Thermoanaerobaculia bacterium]
MAVQAALRVLWPIAAVLVGLTPCRAQVRPVLDRYCVSCHSDRTQTAGLSLETIDAGRPGDAPEVWEKVVRKLRSGDMPPAGRRRPEPEVREETVAWLEDALDRAATAHPDPGRPAIHRLNRTEYANVVRDLLALDVDTHSLLPADDLAYGFDNIADTLSFSPLLLERYLLAARRVSRLAVGDPSLRPEVEIHEAAKIMVQEDRMSEDLPFGSRGGLAVHHRFPLDADYTIRVVLGGRRSGPETLEVRIDGELAASFPVDDAPRKQGWGTDDTDLEVRLPVAAGERTVGVSFHAKSGVAESLVPERLPPANIAGGARRRSVAALEIAGPYDATGPGDTESRRRIFLCRPEESDDETCAHRIVGTLARRAYRRPVTAPDVEELLAFYRQGRERHGFEAGIQRALERILVDPEFLFRVEADPAGIGPGEAYPVSELELASRLSFFLWSSLPDDELLDLAERGELRRDGVLEAQVRRMLSDDRAVALVENFAAQWLHLRNVDAATPDVNRFPEFDDNLRHALRRETELLIASQMREDRAVVDLLATETTFVNERLARHYGIPGVYGSRFRRVELADDARAGLLGQGSLLLVTSYANRTSPVLRGKWLLENILGSPPPPPPPDVPELEEAGAGETPTSIRALMEQHRADPACSGCHARMDPLGFALENFDAIGAWREIGSSGEPIDASGELPDGTRFSGPSELRRVLLERREEFLWTFTSKLLTYALGRGLEPTDAPAVRGVIRAAEPEEYRWSAIVLGIVESTPFQMRRSRS